MLSLTTVLNLQNAAIIKSGAICFSLLLDNQLTASINGSIFRRGFSHYRQFAGIFQHNIVSLPSGNSEVRELVVSFDISPCTRVGN